jgi:hypothetical protein
MGFPITHSVSSSIYQLNFRLKFTLTYLGMQYFFLVSGPKSRRQLSVQEKYSRIITFLAVRVYIVSSLIIVETKHRLVKQNPKIRPPSNKLSWLQCGLGILATIVFGLIFLIVSHVTRFCICH